MSRASDPDWDGVRAYNSPNAVSERLERENAKLQAEVATLRKRYADALEERDIAVAAVFSQDAEEIERLREALGRLVAKLTAVEADESFKGIWGLLHAHSYRYSGPDWHDELADARAAL